jgi:uncharacterized Zn finger protein (UPF0148 family)
MPALKPPPVAPSWPREDAPPAPHLTSDNRCSACNVRPMPLDGMKVCPNCYAMLWHADWATAERKRRDELKAQREAAEQARRDAKQQMRREIAEQRKQFRHELAADAQRRFDAIGIHVTEEDISAIGKDEVK